MGGIKVFAFDGDGVVYKGEKLIKETAEVIRMLQKKGIAVYMASNTSSGTRHKVYKRLNGLIPIDNILTASDLLLEYLEKHYKYVWPLSNEVIEKEIKERGLKIDEKKAECVCLFFHKDFSFSKISIAGKILLSNKPLLSANIDRYYLTDEGIIPGNGFLMRAFESTYKVKAKYFGKPNPEMLLRIARKENIKTKELALVGDMFETDVKAAKNAKCLSIYIDNKVPQIVKEKPDIKTTYKELRNVVESLI
jgi:4-nitrophenyl phosphatase